MNLDNFGVPDSYELRVIGDYIYYELNGGWVWHYENGKLECGSEQPQTLEQIEYALNWAKSKKKWVMTVELDHNPFMYGDAYTVNINRDTIKVEKI